MQAHYSGHGPELTAALLKAFGLRRPLRRRTNALRLVNGSGDGMDGLLLDQYGTHFAAQVLRAHWLPRMGDVLDCLRQEGEVAYFVVKDRTRSRSAAPDAAERTVLLDAGGGASAVVQEYGLKFQVDVADGLNAGLFLDMRANRHSMGQLAEKRRVLNCFSYTCSFGVHARAGGAAEVVNVDLSKKVLERGKANYALNRLKPGAQEFTAAETGAYLRRAVRKDNRFDMVILDPPSFARADGKVFRVEKELPGLLADTVNALTPGGIVFVSTNFTGVGFKDLTRMLAEAAQNRTVKKVVRIGQDADFPGSNTFKESYLTGLWAVLG